MTYHFVKLDEKSGVVIGSGSTPQWENIKGQVFFMDPADIPPPADLAKYYVDMGELRPRPTCLEPDGASYDLMALPAGTVISVSNEAGDKLEITELAAPLTLTDPGDYYLDVRPPLPYLPIRKTVTVNA